MAEMQVLDKPEQQAQESLPVFDVPQGLSDDQLDDHYRLSSFYTVPVSLDLGVVDGKFRIDTSRPLPHLDTANAKAFEVTDTSENYRQPLYAMICDNNYPLRLHAVSELKKVEMPNFCNVISYQVVFIESIGSRRLCIVIEKPVGISLRQYVNDNGKVKEDVLDRHFIPTINNVIARLQRLDITHGCINLDKVYMKEDATIMVGECVSETCGASQLPLYEDVDRAICPAYGKGYGDRTVDVYALGVLAAFLLSGRDISAGQDADVIIDLKYRVLTYYMVAHNQEYSTHILDFLRGTINDRRVDVWDTDRVEEWCKGRIFNLLPPPGSVEATRPLNFCGVKYQHRKHLAYGMFKNWEEAKELIRKDDSFIRWIDRSIEDREMADDIDYVIQTSFSKNSAGGYRSFDQYDELLTRILLILDPSSIIRTRNFVADVGGVGPSLAYAMANDHTDTKHAVDAILAWNVFNVWSNPKEGLDMSLRADSLLNLEKCVQFNKRQTIGFGIERCLYQLNRTLPCQHPSIINHCAFGMADYLLIQEMNEDVQGVITDNLSAAFLAYHVDISIKISIPNLIRFPEFDNSPYVQMLSLMVLAQEKSKIPKLYRLCDKVVKEYEPVFDMFNSSIIRKQVIDACHKEARSGVLANILHEIADNEFLVTDRIRFSRAVNEYRNNAVRILRLSNGRAIGEVGYRYGLQITVILSFLIAAMTLLVLVVKSL